MSRARSCLPVPPSWPAGLATLPFRHEAVVFHVGDLRQASAMRAGSYEGPGLSVSRTPDAWTRIAKLGGWPTWTVTRQDGTPGQFVDLLACSRAQRRALTDLAVGRGLLVPTTHFVVERYDDEFETVFATTHETLADALAELEPLDLPDALALQTPAGDWDVSAAATAFAPALARLTGSTGTVKARVTLVGEPSDPRPVPDEDGPMCHRLVAERGWAATEALDAWWRATFTGRLDASIAEEMAWLACLGTWDAIDGCWWTEELDPSRLSAPRGVVMPHALPRWSWRPATPAELEAHSLDDAEA